MLDAAGLTDCKIVASNSLDEYIIRDLLLQGAQIDSFGVGERLITSKSEPVFGGVYKLAAVEDKEGNIIPKIKISENPAKITNPHFKKVYRLFENETGKAIADLITRPRRGHRPQPAPGALRPGRHLEAQDLYRLHRPGAAGAHLPGRQAGVPVPLHHEMRTYCAAQVDLLWDEVKRFENPHNYYVDLSQKLWDIKHELLKQAGHI